MVTIDSTGVQAREIGDFIFVRRGGKEEVGIRSAGDTEGY